MQASHYGAAGEQTSIVKWLESETNKCCKTATLQVLCNRNIISFDFCLLHYPQVLNLPYAAVLSYPVIETLIIWWWDTSWRCMWSYTDVKSHKPGFNFASCCKLQWRSLTTWFSCQNSKCFLGFSPFPSSRQDKGRTRSVEWRSPPTARSTRAESLRLQSNNITF